MYVIARPNCKVPFNMYMMGVYRFLNKFTDDNKYCWCMKQYLSII